MRNLHYLFNPESIVLVGASDTEGKAGNTILSNLGTWKGPLFLVNQSIPEINGRKVYREIEELPDHLDLAIIALGSAKAVEAARKCAQKGFRNLIVIASGFSEIGKEGVLLENELRKEVLSKGTRILGPNTLGVFIPGTGIDTIFVEHGDKMFSEPGDVAFITQSGSVGVESLGAAGVIGWSLRAFVGIGNRIDIGENDLLEYFSRDEKTKCIALYLETFDDAQEFMKRSAQITPVKPIVLLMAGKTEMARDAVASHTGKMASVGQVFYGVAKQIGVHLANHEEELADYSKVLSREPPAVNPRMAIVTCAGGYGIIALDLLSDAKYLKRAELSADTVSKIRKIVPSYASLSNPIDLTASADNGMIANTLKCLENDSNVGIIFTFAFFAPSGIDLDLIDILAEHRSKTKKPFIVCVAYGPYTNELAHRLYQKGVVAFTSLSRAMKAMDILAERAIYLGKQQIP